MKTDSEKLVDSISNDDNVKAHDLLKKILVDKAGKRIKLVLNK